MRMVGSIMVFVACALPVGVAQAIQVDHLTQIQLLEKARELNAKAQGSDGAASARLNEYPNHFTMISLRSKDGGAEIHEDYADFFFVVQGSATLVTGGTVEGGATISPGEIRGKSVLNGTRTILNQGDIVHIPATVSHQLSGASGETFVYFVIKVKEK